MKDSNGTYSGNYAGYRLVTFDIIADIEDAVVGQVADQAYTGKPIRPGVSISFEGTPLVEGSDYTISYINNTNVGIASYSIVGTGDYLSGSIAGSFRILYDLDKAEISGVETSYTYCGKKIKPEVDE